MNTIDTPITSETLINSLPNLLGAITLEPTWSEQPLSVLETIALKGMVAREAEIMREHLGPLQADYQAIVQQVEVRLGLPAGSLGTTYVMDIGSSLVRKVNIPEAKDEQENHENGQQVNDSNSGDK